jgi:hypothetical protein
MISHGFSPAMAAAAEFIARSDPNPKLDLWLAAHGVDVGLAWNMAGPICAHDVVLRPRRIFNFAESEADSALREEVELANRGDDIRAVVHVARDVDDATPVDLVAWRPHNPACIFRYLGEAVMLGASQFGNPASYFAGGALTVHRTALDWLTAGCRGVVILDPKEFAFRLSALPTRPGGYALAAADLTHAKLLSTVWTAYASSFRSWLPHDTQSHFYRRS